MKRPASWPLITILCGLLCISSRPAYAFRPFNGTDAAVASRGEIEIECGPFGYVVDAEGRFLVIPAVILNVGFAEGWEVVIEGRNFLRLSPPDMDRSDTVRETALSVKGILREGGLQDKNGPSVAIESSLLLPGIGTDPGVGASFTAIVSQRWSAVTLHVNGEVILTHEHELGGFASAIMEGPFDWQARPVAELTAEQDAGKTTSALVGAIWQIREHLSVDAGFRVARSEGANVREFRAGFTVAFPFAASSGGRRSTFSNPLSRQRLGA